MRDVESSDTKVTACARIQAEASKHQTLLLTLAVIVLAWAYPDFGAEAYPYLNKIFIIILFALLGLTLEVGRRTSFSRLSR
jgi:hypothetical protein